MGRHDDGGGGEEGMSVDCVFGRRADEGRTSVRAGVRANIPKGRWHGHCGGYKACGGMSVGEWLGTLWEPQGICRCNNPSYFEKFG